MKRYRFLVVIGLGLALLSWVPGARIAAAEESACVKVPAESMPGAKCRDAVGAPKPALDLIEDGLAYLLDIPLAILSPITCPIISPILDDINEKQERYYVRAKRCP